MSYEQSATDTGMVTQYIDLIKDTVESKMIELVMNTILHPTYPDDTMIILQFFR